MSELTCFKAYDIRGELGIDIDAQIAYRIGRSVTQHFNAKKVVVGWDARETLLNLEMQYQGHNGCQEMSWILECLVLRRCTKCTNLRQMPALS